MTCLEKNVRLKKVYFFNKVVVGYFYAIKIWKIKKIFFKIRPQANFA